MAIPEDDIAKRFKIAKLRQMLENLETDEEAVIKIALLRGLLTEEEVQTIDGSMTYNTFKDNASADAEKLWEDIKKLIRFSNLIAKKPYDQTQKLRRKIFTKSEAIIERFEQLSLSDQNLFTRSDRVEDKWSPFERIEDYPPPIPNEFYDEYSEKGWGKGSIKQSNKNKRNSAQQSAIKWAIDRLSQPDESEMKLPPIVEMWLKNHDKRKDD